MRESSNLHSAPKTRVEALATGATKYFPDLPCANGHRSARYVSSRGRCCECASLAAKRHHHKNRELRARQYKEYIRQNPDAWYKAHLKRAFGLSLDDYYALVRAHAGRCGICGSSDPRSKKNQRSLPGWHVDHDHSTGTIRGILCQPCNHMLGNARDNTAILLLGVDYLGGCRAPYDALTSSALSLGN